MPTYTSYCPECKSREDRFLAYSERDGAPCPQCGTVLEWPFCTNHVSVVCYGANSKWNPVFTGPKQKAKYLGDRGYFELGSESMEQIKENDARITKDLKIKNAKDVERVCNEALMELGDAGLYESQPKHVMKRKEREARDIQDVDLTGAGINE